MTQLKVKQLVVAQYTDLSEADNTLTYKLLAVGEDGCVYVPDLLQTGWRRTDMTITNVEQYTTKGTETK